MKTRLEYAIISLDDFRRIHRLYGKAIWRIVAISALFIMASIFSKPVPYRATGLFYQQSEESTIPGTLFGLMGGKRGSGGLNFEMVLNTPDILVPVMRHRGLQVREVKTIRYLGRVHHLWGHISRMLRIPLSTKLRFDFSDVYYPLDEIKEVFIVWEGGDRYRLLGADNKVLAYATLGQKVDLMGYSFTLSKIEAIKIGKKYHLRFYPEEDVLGWIKENISVKKVPGSPALLSVSFAYPEVMKACQVVDELMKEYKIYLYRSNDVSVEEHLTYLNKRKRHLRSDYEQLLERNIEELGHRSPENQFLLATGEKEQGSVLLPYYKRLHEIDFEMSRLHTQVNEPPSLEISTAASKKDDQKLVIVENWIRQLNTKEPLDEQSIHLLDPHLLAGIWVRQFNQKLADSHAELDGEKKKLHRYLTQYADLLHLRKKAQLSMDLIDQMPIVSPEGADILQANKFIVKYLEEIDTNQALMQNLLYLQEQIIQPEFLFSSFQFLTEDPLIREVIKESASLERLLNDSDNLAPRERGRMLENLETARQFVKAHVAHSLELLKLKCFFLYKKVKHLKEFSVRLLQSEKENLLQQVQGKHRLLLDSVDLIKRDKLSDFEAKADLKALEKMSELIEGKILDQHLFSVNSRLLEKAGPDLPPPYRQLVWAGILCFGIGLAGYSLAFIREVMKGLPLTRTTLEELEAKILGSLNTPQYQRPHCEQICAQNITSELLKLPPSKKQLIHLVGPQMDQLWPSVARWLTEHGRRVLVVELDALGKEMHLEGLRKHLKDPDHPLHILKHPTYHLIPWGISSRSDSELLLHPYFQETLRGLQEEYDTIFLVQYGCIKYVKPLGALNQVETRILYVEEDSWKDIKLHAAWEEERAERSLYFALAAQNA